MRRVECQRLAESFVAALVIVGAAFWAGTVFGGPYFFLVAGAILAAFDTYLCYVVLGLKADEDDDV